MMIGIYNHNNAALFKKKKKEDPELARADEIRRMVRLGSSNSQIAKKLEISKDSVLKYRKKYNI